jgi:gamma-glutamylputrescine oxidase
VKISKYEQQSSGFEDSYYKASANPLEGFSSLSSQIQADVCIIGAGYTGLSTALHLAEKGYSVVVLDAEKVGWGASGRNGGHVGTGQRKGQDELEKMVGVDTAHLLWDLGFEAVTLVRNLIDKFNIQCDLADGILHTACKPREVDELKAYVDKLGTEYNYEQVSFHNKAEIDQMLGSTRFYGGYLDAGAAHLHPLNFARGLAQACVSLGVGIFEDSRVLKVTEGPAARVTTSAGQVTAKFVVYGCNGYLGNLQPKIAGKIMPINNFMLATEPLGPDGARALIRDNVAVEDSLFVINYWKLSSDHRLLFGGGENYRSRFPDDLKNFVRKYMLRIYPQLENTRIDYAWGGTLAISMNRMPHLGRLAPNVFYAHGYSGHGVPTATLCGKLMAEAISGTAERFDVMAKVPTHTFPGGTLLRWPGLVVGMLYYAMLDRL